MMKTFPGFPPEALRFLRQLKRNNNREWFRAHKEIFDLKVKVPMVEVVLALGGALQSFAPELITEPDRAIYRIYRDTRFSPDKTPYKTHIAAHFAPRGVAKHAGAGLYFHIEPSEALIAGGIYMPGSAVAALSTEAVLLSYDLGQTWNRILPPLQPATDSSPSFVAIGEDLVAVADSRGRVYTGDLTGWSCCGSHSIRPSLTGRPWILDSSATTMSFWIDSILLRMTPSINCTFPRSSSG